MLKSAPTCLLALACTCFVLARPQPSSADAVCPPSAIAVGGAGWLACAGSSGRPPVNPVILQPQESGSDQGSGRPSSKGSSQQAFCTYSDADTVDGTAAPAPRAGGGRWVFVYCGDSGQPGGWTWVAAGAAVVLPSAAELARQAYARLSPTIGVPQFNPHQPTGSGPGTVVGFDTWFWLDGAGLRSRSATASAGPNAATVTARAVSVSFDPGDGTASVLCPGGGTAYDPAEPAAVSNCLHRYLQPSVDAAGGVFVLTARVVWAAAWTGTGGTGGTLPALTVTAQTPVRVIELQAVNE